MQHKRQPNYLAIKATGTTQTHRHTHIDIYTINSGSAYHYLGGIFKFQMMQ